MKTRTWLGWDRRALTTQPGGGTAAVGAVPQRVTPPTPAAARRPLLSSLLPQEHTRAPAGCAPGSPPRPGNSAGSQLLPHPSPGPWSRSVWFPGSMPTCMRSHQSHERVNVFTPVMRPSGEFLVRLTCHGAVGRPGRYGCPPLVEQDVGRLRADLVFRQLPHVTVVKAVPQAVHGVLTIGCKDRAVSAGAAAAGPRSPQTPLLLLV